MDIKVNAIELASELADLAVRRELCDNESLDEGDGDWEKVYQHTKDCEGTTYTDEAQDCFLGWYDYYLAEIEKYKL